VRRRGGNDSHALNLKGVCWRDQVLRFYLVVMMNEFGVRSWRRWLARNLIQSTSCTERRGPLLRKLEWMRLEPMRRTTVLVKLLKQHRRLVPFLLPKADVKL
jgi:hypothetical protein